MYDPNITPGAVPGSQDQTPNSGGSKQDALGFFWRDAPPQREPYPWEKGLTPEQIAQNDARRAEALAASAKATQELKDRQARLDAEPDDVKKARLSAQNSASLAEYKEREIEVEKLRLQQAEVKTGASNTALPPQASPTDITLNINTGSETTVRIDYLMNPWLPRGQVVGVYGRGEGGKSSRVATLAADLSSEASTLWISTEEPVDWIKVRHSKSGGEVGTIAVFEALVTKRDSNGRSLASVFNVYEHLDASIQQAIKVFDEVGTCSLGLVVLDTAVALTTWGKTESPNSDAAVKKLMAYLLSLAQKYDVCIVVIGHSNKGSHDHISDAVMGARAWVDSPRQSFLHAQDQREEHAFVAYAIKASLTGTFAAPFKSIPVHELFKRPDGSSSVLCKVEVGEIVWGKFKADDLWDAATQKPDENGFDHATGEPSSGAKRKYALLAQVMTTVVRMVQANTGPVTRHSVQAELCATVHNRDWVKVDSALALQNIVALPGSNHGELTYVQKQT